MVCFLFWIYISVLTRLFMITCACFGAMDDVTIAEPPDFRIENLVTEQSIGRKARGQGETLPEAAKVIS